MNVAEAVGRALASLGVDAVFGLLGSGNLTFTNALRHAGVPFYASRHEGGAICMADGYARASGRLAACTTEPQTDRKISQPRTDHRVRRRGDHHAQHDLYLAPHHARHRR